MHEVDRATLQFSEKGARLFRARDNSRMARFVFFLPGGIAPETLAAAKKTARALDVSVLRSVPGSMLVEATPAKAAHLAEALPDWRYAPERKTTRVPERTPLERAKVVSLKARRIPPT